MKGGVGVGERRKMEGARDLTRRKICLVWFGIIALPFALLILIPGIPLPSIPNRFTSTDDNVSVNSKVLSSTHPTSSPSKNKVDQPPLSLEKTTNSDQLNGEDNTPSDSANADRTSPKDKSTISDVDDELAALGVEPELPALSGIGAETKTSVKKEEVSSKEKEKEERLTKGQQHQAAIPHPTTKSEKSCKGSAACVLTKGRWVEDSMGPSYSNDSCPYISEHQNCMRNGRPDQGYLYWRWKPDGCTLPRFNASLFINRLRSKNLAFVGDSIARNQMQSLLCLFSQVEKPNQVFSAKANQTQSWSFPNHNLTISVFWAPYLVKDTEDYFNQVPAGILKLFLDVLEKDWVAALPQIDYLVISTGHWFMKNAVHFINNQVAGCHHCTDINESKKIKEIGFYDPFRASLRTTLRGVTSLPGYRGTTFFQTFIVDHFENGSWDNGGTCPQKRPIIDLDKNSSIWGKLEGVSKDMYNIQLQEFDHISRKETPNTSKLKLLDISYSALLRPDGHPGPYRSPKKSLSNEGGPVQNDCLHWCLPGPIDAWNEIIMEMINSPGDCM